MGSTSNVFLHLEKPRFNAEVIQKQAGSSLDVASEKSESAAYQAATKSLISMAGKRSSCALELTY